MKVKSTKNYSRFHYLPANRKVMPKHVDNMVKSIQAMGIIRPVVVGRTSIDSTGEKAFIIDGQHLESACRRLDIAVPYVEIDVNSEEDMITKMGMLNTTSKSWTLANFVDAYITLPSKKVVYQKLFDLRKNYNLEYAVLSALCTMNASWDSPAGTRHLKEGKLKILNKNVDVHVRDLKEMTDLVPNCDHNLKRRLVRGMIASGGNYDFDKVMKNMRANLKKLELMGSDAHSADFINKVIFNLK